MKKLIKILGTLAVVIVFSACTDLTEQVYDEQVSDEFYQSEAEIISAMAPAYSSLRNLLHIRSILAHEEQTTDIMVPVTRIYGGWYDGGHSQKHHEHTWDANTGYINIWWSHAFEWVNQANRLTFQFEQLEDMDPELRDTFTSELKVLRSFGYYYLLNSFGNVPIVDRFDVEPGFSPSNNSDFDAGRREVFEFIENNLLEAIPNLSPAVDASTYGRFNRWAAMALTVKLYMNAEVWTGEPHWQEAIDYADQIINSGNYQLEPNYFKNFTVENDNSSETIFAIPFHPTLTGGFMSTWVYVASYHFSSQPTVNAPRGANNGMTANPQHIHSFHPDDKRLNGWNWGPQYILGTQEIATSTIRPVDQPLVFTIDFIDVADETGGERQYDYTNAPGLAGARPHKYEINYSAGEQAANDLPVWRLADIMLMKAEAIMRQNGGQATQEAVNLVNRVRARAFDNPGQHEYTTSTLTLDALLQEREWELYYEGHRRNDLIRFGEFAGGDWPFYDRSGHDETKNWFPIPQSQINANPNLNQNPGY